MPRKPRLNPVSSFGPEIMAALLKGAKERFEVGPMEYRKAIQLHLRLHALRRAMAAEQHSQSTLVTRAKVSLIWGPKAGLPEVEERTNSRGVKSPRDPAAPTKVLIEPHDSHFRDILLQSGVTAKELEEDPLLSHDKASEAPLSPEADYLDQILGVESRKKLP